MYEMFTTKMTIRANIFSSLEWIKKKEISDVIQVFPQKQTESEVPKKICVCARFHITVYLFCGKNHKVRHVHEGKRMCRAVGTTNMADPNCQSWLQFSWMRSLEI